MTDLKKVIGFKVGTWTNEKTGVVYPVRRLYVIYPSDVDGLTGLMAAVLKCKGDNVFDGIQEGDFVQILYDQYGNVVQIQPVEPEPEDLIDFHIGIELD